MILNSKKKVCDATCNEARSLWHYFLMLEKFIKTVKSVCDCDVPSEKKMRRDFFRPERVCVAISNHNKKLLLRFLTIRKNV